MIYFTALVIVLLAVFIILMTIRLEKYCNVQQCKDVSDTSFVRWPWHSYPHWKREYPFRNYPDYEDASPDMYCLTNCRNIDPYWKYDCLNRCHYLH